MGSVPETLKRPSRNPAAVALIERQGCSFLMKNGKRTSSGK